MTVKQHVGADAPRVPLRRARSALDSAEVSVHKQNPPAAEFGETLRRQGYSTVTLAEASEELLEQYRQTPYSEYANPLNHQHLILPGAEITKDVSVMCTLNGRLAAYVFAYMPDRYSAIFKTLSSSAALQGGAAILLPLCESFAKVRGRGCTQFVFSMDGVGDHANSFRNKVLSNVISKTSKRLSYIYHKKEAAI